MDVKDYTIGAMVARFQVHELHEGQHHVIRQVTENHRKTILFLGVPRFVGLKKNPLDFDTRKRMIQSDYPDTIVIPLPDMRDNVKWTRELERRLREVFQHGDILLYGSRDSFIPHYVMAGGVYHTKELEPLGTWTGTNVRKTASEEVLSSKDFRAGIIYHSQNMYPRVIPMVDVIANKGDEVLLVRKYDEDLFRLPGGFLLPGDNDVLSAAKRVLIKETGGYETGNLSIKGTCKIDDWRFRGEDDSVMTTVVSLEILWGNPSPSDDIAEIRMFKKEDITESIVVSEHHVLLKYIK
jgi:bifunctional NMN adenylyltransferase/nudix hydrolase